MGVSAETEAPTKMLYVNKDTGGPGHGTYVPVSVTNGTSYTFTAQFAGVGAGISFIRLNGSAVGGSEVTLLTYNGHIANAYATGEGAVYDTKTSTLSYTFTAQGSELQIWVYRDGSWSQYEWDRETLYFYNPVLKAADNSYVDCDPDFSGWVASGDGAEQVIDYDASKFVTKTAPEGKIYAYHGWEWANADGRSVDQSLTVESGKYYTLQLLWMYEAGTPYFNLYGAAMGGESVRVVEKDYAMNGATYNRATGELSYTFKAKGTALMVGAGVAKTGTWQGFYFAQPTLFESDAEGNPTGVAFDLDDNFDSNKWGVYNNLHNTLTEGGTKDPLVDDTFFNNTPKASLSALTVGDHTLTPAFDNAIDGYKLTVPNDVTSLTVIPTLGADGKSVVVNGADDLVEGANTVTVEVTNNDDTVTKYSLWVTRQSNVVTIPAAKLEEYSNGGNSYVNTLYVESGKTYTFTVLWKATAGTPSFNLYNSAIEGGKKSLTYANDPTDGVTRDMATGKYTYTFTAAGSTLSIGGAFPATGYTGFYFAEPTLYESDAEGNKTGDEIDCSPAFDANWSNYPNNAGFSVEEVARSFFKQESTSTLTSLKVNGYELDRTFDPNIKNYKLTENVPFTQNSLDIQVSLASDKASYKILGNENLPEGTTSKVTVEVTDEDGTVNNYYISLTKGVDPTQYTVAMHLKQWGHNAGVSNTVKVTPGKTYTFKAQWKYVAGTDPFISLGGTVTYGSSALHGVKKLVERDIFLSGVTYDDDTDYLVYTFTSVGDYLTIVARMGSEYLQGESRECWFANPTLYESDADGNPVEGGEVINCDPEFDDFWQREPWGDDYRHVEYVENGFFDRVIANALTDLKVGYDLSVPFDPMTYFYEITVPYNVDKLENIQYTLAEGTSLNGITGNENFVEDKTNDVVIAVNDDVGGVTKYTLRVYREKEPAAQLLTLNVGYDLDPAFTPEKTTYSLLVPSNVEKLDIQYTLAENATLVGIEGNEGFKVGIPTNVKIILKDTKDQENTYTITVTREGLEADNDAMKALLEKALEDVKITNATTKESLEEALKEATADSSYDLAVADFYKLTAVPHVKDNFGTIIPGEIGYITAIVNVVDGDQMAQVPLKLAIEAPVKEYTFTEDEVSKEDDFVLSSDGKVLEYYGGDAKKIVVPDGVEELAFAWNDAWDPEAVQVLVIPDSVTTIPPQLTAMLTRLEVAYLGDGITELNESAFENCMLLQYVRLPKNLKVIDRKAFAGTLTLTQLRLPDSLQEIREDAFVFSLLRDITIPAGVKTIQTNALGGPFSVAEQLVKGSDNFHNWYPFSSLEDPTLLYIKDVAESVVDWMTVDGKYTWDKMDDSPLGDPTWPYGDITCTPRTVTLLSADTQVEERAFYGLGIWCGGGSLLRAPEGCSAYNIAKEEADTGKHVTAGHLQYVFVEPLNMSLVEAAARAQYAADKLAVTAADTEDTIAAAIKNSYYSNKIGDLTWVEALDIFDETATGVLGMTSGKVTFEIDLDVPVVDGDTIAEEEPEDIPIFALTENAYFATLDEKKGVLTVEEGTTVAKLVNFVTLQEGYYLAFFDDNGYFIPEEYYVMATLEEGFVMQVKTGNDVIQEYTVAVKLWDGGWNDDGWNTNPDHVADTDTTPNDGEDTVPGDTEDATDSEDEVLDETDASDDTEGNGETTSPGTGVAFPVALSVVVILSLAAICLLSPKALFVRGK